jgi:hypothetical protein
VRPEIMLKQKDRAFERSGHRFAWKTGKNICDMIARPRRRHPELSRRGKNSVNNFISP